jgi:Tetratricopeptide repeat
MRSESPELGNTDFSNYMEEANQAYARNDYARAEELYKQSLNYLDSVGLGESPESALCLQNLAEIYHQGGQPQWSIPLYRRLLTLGEKILGPHHGEVIATAYRLATTYDDIKMKTEAEEMFKRAAGSAERTYGLSHPTSKKIRDAYFNFLAIKNGGDEPGFDMPPPPPKLSTNPAPSAIPKAPAMPVGMEDVMPPPPPPKTNIIPKEDVMPPPPPPLSPNGGRKGQPRLVQSESGSNSPLIAGQSGVDFALLAENTGPSKTVKRPGGSFKRPSKIANLRYGEQSAEESVEKSLAVKNFAARWQIILTVSCSFIALIVFAFYIGTYLTSNATTTGYENAVENILNKQGTYASVDGVGGVEFLPDHKCKFVNDVNHREIPYQILKGTWSDISIVLRSAFSHKEIWYQLLDEALISDDGVTLYAVLSPEHEVAKQMKAYEAYLQTFYSKNGTYPSSEKKLREENGIVFVNPFSGMSETPHLQGLDGRMEKELLFENYKANPKVEDPVLDFLRHGGTWKDLKAPAPGRLVSLAMRKGVERVGEYYKVEEFFIMSYDKFSHLLSGGLPGTSYVIALKNGRQVTDDEVDRKKDMERFSIHPPEKVLIVHGDTSYLNAMRSGVPVLLGLLLLGDGCLWVLFEAKERRANSKMLPQKFEIIGISIAAILLLMLFMHIMP